jgi:phosphonate transport system ATP-binding protein
MLTLDGVGVVYPRGATALHPTTLTIAAGGFNVLLGPSGAGKSTLLRTLNGLVTPTTGTIRVDGIGEIGAKAALRRHRRATGMIFQQHHLIGRVSALGNVLMGRLGYHSCVRTLLPPSHAEKHLALQALERVGLLEFANRRADQLSGGQQQRVGIARALVQQPRLMLADEPVASLDPATAERALGLMQDICRSDGITAIVSLHQVDLARRFADRIIGLNGGRVVVDAAPPGLDEAALVAIYGPSEAKGPRPPATSQSHQKEMIHEPQTAAA